VIAPLDAYFGTAHILKDLFEPWGLQVSFVDMTDLNLTSTWTQHQRK
jgi:cystathionine gamma-synthase